MKFNVGDLAVISNESSPNYGQIVEIDTPHYMHDIYTVRYMKSGLSGAVYVGDLTPIKDSELIEFKEPEQELVFGDVVEYSGNYYLYVRTLDNNKHVVGNVVDEYGHPCDLPKHLLTKVDRVADKIKYFRSLKKNLPKRAMFNVKDKLFKDLVEHVDKVCNILEIQAYLL